MQHSRKVLQLAQRSVCLPLWSGCAGEAGTCAYPVYPKCVAQLRSIVTLAQIPATETAQSRINSKVQRCQSSIPALQLPAQQQRQLFGLSAGELNKDYKERRLIGYTYNLQLQAVLCTPVKTR